MCSWPKMKCCEPFEAFLAPYRLWLVPYAAREGIFMMFSKLVSSLKLENLFFLLKGLAIWMAHCFRLGRVFCKIGQERLKLTGQTYFDWSHWRGWVAQNFRQTEDQHYLYLCQKAALLFCQMGSCDLVTGVCRQSFFREEQKNESMQVTGGCWGGLKS